MEGFKDILSHIIVKLQHYRHHAMCKGSKTKNRFKCSDTADVKAQFCVGCMTCQLVWTFSVLCTQFVSMWVQSVCGSPCSKQTHSHVYSWILYNSFNERRALRSVYTNLFSFTLWWYRRYGDIYICVWSIEHNTWIGNFIFKGW